MKEIARRHREHDVPLRYIARDMETDRGFIQPQHAVFDPSIDADAFGQVRWIDHPQGGQMEPFGGPDEVWEALIENSRPYGTPRTPRTPR